MPTGFVLYRSLTDLRPSDQGCHDILSEARVRNAALELTGHLHLEDGSFFQWLEGPVAQLTQVRHKIQCDPRHQNMDILAGGMQQGRQFGEWSMGFGSSQPGTLFNWIADSGISVADRAAFANGLLAFLRADLAA